jgi:thiamine transport system permease protein
MPRVVRNFALNLTYKFSLITCLFGLTVLGFLPVCYAFLTHLSGESLKIFLNSSDQQNAIINSLVFTVLQAAASASVSTAAGLCIARVFWLLPGRLSRLTIRLLVIPFGLPSVVISFAVIVAFGNAGYLNRILNLMGMEAQFLYNAGAIVFAHAFFNTGMAAREFMGRYASIPIAFWRTSATLGLNRLDQFRHVEWPYLWRSVVSLWALIFAMCLSSFAIVLTLGGRPDLATLEVLIYQLIRYESDLSGAFMAVAIQTLFLLCVSLLAYTGAKSLGQPPPSGHAVADPTEWCGYPLTKKRAIIQEVSYFLTLLLCAICFIFPLGALVADGLIALLNTRFTSLLQQFSKELLPSLSTSLLVGIPVATLSTYGALVFAQFVARAPQSGSLHRLLQVVTFTLIAFSPTVLGFSWLQTYVGLSLNPFAFSYFTVIGIQTFLFFPMAFRVIYPDAVLRYHSARNTYQSLNIPIGLQTLWVELLEVFPTIRRAFLLTLAFSVGDAATPALFGDVDFAPLALHLLELMGSYQFDKASIATVVLLGATQVLSLIGTRKSSQ